MWIVANWKSNLNIKESIDWIDAVGPKLLRDENLKIVVCPSFEALGEVKKAIEVGGYPIFAGSQDLSPFGEGAFTGEVNAESLKDLVNFSIIGHSERRDKLGETDDLIEEKSKEAQKFSIEPILCIQSAETPIPKNVKLVAYEPVFAIGSGNPDTPENANRVASTVKKIINNKLEVLYGGSVAPSNIKDFVNEPEIDGVLIGKACLVPDEFLKMVDACKD